MPTTSIQPGNEATALTQAIRAWDDAAAKVEAQFRAEVALRAPHWAAVRWDGNYERRFSDGQVNFNLYEMAVLLPDGTEHFVAGNSEDHWINALECERDISDFEGDALDTQTVSAFVKHQASVLGVSVDFLHAVGDATAVLAQRGGAAGRITFQPPVVAAASA